MEELRLVPFSEYHIDCRILEVEPGASLEEIRQAYRDQTKVWHPDRFSNDLRLQKKAEEKTKQINLAYRRLCGLSPYEQPVLSPAIPESSSEWIAVIMLRQWLRTSVTVISKPFRLLIRKVVNISNNVFQWCRRERRALAIATSAFVLGFAFGAWLLPRDSETWVKISSLLQKTIEKNGMAQAAVAQASAAPTVLAQTGLIATSSPETGASVPSSFFGTSSNPPMTAVSADGFPWEANVTTTPFWVGDGQVTGKTLTQYASAWEKHWLKIFGGGDDPERTARGNYIPISFVPHQNTFYYALPYNDVERGHLKPEEPNVVPLSKQIQGEPDYDIARQQPEESTRKRPAHPAAVEPSHASAPSDQSGMLSFAVAPEKELAERKKPANPFASKPVQGHRAPTESVMRASAKAVTTYAPRPDYPEEARSRRIAGSGVCVVSVDPYTGSVTNASMAQSTGSQLLDKSVLRTLRTWKFKPGTVSQVSVPVEFTTEAENP